MKAAALLSSKTLSLHHSSLTLSRSFFPYKSSLSILPIFHFPLKQNTNFTQNPQIHTRIMASSSYNPEQARAPTAIPLPTPPVNKVTPIPLLLFFSFIDFIFLLNFLVGDFKI
jgi:hypothetical protein